MTNYLNSLQIYYGLKTLLLSDSQQELVIRSSEGQASLLFFETILFNKKHDDRTWKWKIISIVIVLMKNRLLLQGDELNTIDSIWSIKEAFKNKYPSVSDDQLNDLRIEVSVSADNQIRSEIQKQLMEYSKLFILGELHGKGNEFTFEKHVVLFREYLESKLSNVSEKNIHIQKSELIQRFIVREYGKAEFDFRFMDTLFVLWSTKILNISKLGASMLLNSDNHNGYDQNERIDYESNISIKQIHLLTVDAIRKTYGFEPIAGTKFVLPKDQKFSYMYGTLTVPFVGGGGATILFKKESKKIFDTFHNLWINNQKGHYSIDEVKEMYKSTNNGASIEQHSISINKAPIIKKIKDSLYFRDRIVFVFDYDSQEWIFKILI